MLFAGKRWEEMILKTQPVMALRVNQLAFEHITAVPNIRNKLCLDVGSDRNALSRRLRKQGVNAIGIDIDPESRTDVIADATNLSFHNNSFDIVSSVCVDDLLSLTEFYKMLIEIHRVTIGGGMFFKFGGNELKCYPYAWKKLDWNYPVQIFEINKGD